MVNNLRELTSEYLCLATINLYKSPTNDGLETQASVGRHLEFLSETPVNGAREVRLCEDGYRAWLRKEDENKLTKSQTKYQIIALSPEQIQECIPTVIKFALYAMQQPNKYCWGGTVSPDYDCSGLMQAAFAASNIWIPRDSYQQADFTQPVELNQIQRGDLVFFANPETNKVNHVGLYLGDGFYIHCSGRDHGRNSIAIDRLVRPEISSNRYNDEITSIAKYHVKDVDEFSQICSNRFFRAGRVVKIYQPS